MKLWRVPVEANRGTVMDEGRGGTRDIAGVVTNNDRLKIGKPLLFVATGRGMGDTYLQSN